MLLKSKKKNGRYLVSVKAVRALCPVPRRPWAKLAQSDYECRCVMQEGPSYAKDKLRARLCVPTWVFKLIDNEQLKTGLRVRHYADTPRRLDFPVSNGTVIGFAVQNKVPYLKVKMDGQSAREALYWHPSHFKLAKASAPLARKRMQFRITWSDPRTQSQAPLKQAA